MKRVVLNDVSNNNEINLSNLVELKSSSSFSTFNALINKKEKFVLLTLINLLYSLPFQVLNSISDNDAVFELIPILAHYSYEAKLIFR